MYGPGSVRIAATTRATSSVVTGEVRPVPNGSRMVPLSAMERAARVVNNGLSKKTVGRTCTTGSPDQLSTCSDSQFSSRRELRYRGYSRTAMGWQQ
jgi:hypothetical protein